MRAAALSMAVAASIAAACHAAPAPGPAPGPLRGDHPVVGTWRITMPDGSCSETYRIRSDGTTLVFSNEEVAESTFTISDQPDKDGFYQETDTIVKDNGKLDCTGEITTPGKAVTNYLQFNPSGNMFVMCMERSLERCIGPFVRVRGEPI